MQMAKLKHTTISRRTVERLSVEKGTLYWDRALPGFGVRVYPSRLRSLRSLRGPLARRLAALTAVSSARRRPHSRTPPCSRRSASRALTRHGGFPPVPFPEPISLSFGTLGLVLWTPGGGLALTPHASPMPCAPCLRSGAQECAGHTLHYDLNRHQPSRVRWTECIWLSYTFQAVDLHGKTGFRIP